MADKYEYLRVVGKGSFGKAWLVRSKASQRQYVLKEIQVSDMGEKDRHQAVNEVAILARLKHKNVVRYREAFVSAGTLNIIMVYADGGDLGHQIQQAKGLDKMFSETQVMRWFVQIAFALVYIHNLKILHRDLKPQNIFLTNKDVIKIGDFGIARTLENSQDRANTAIGTPYYLSPEICRRQPYNQKSDMWAAGCVLYELLARSHPFEAEDFSVLVLKILRGKYKDISSIYGPLPRDLVNVLLRVNPERRPSAEQILSIPSIRHYVQEYISRSSNVVSLARSDAPSGTPPTEQENQTEVKSVERDLKGRQIEQEERTIMAATKDKCNQPSDISVCSAAPFAVAEISYKQSGIVDPNESPDCIKNVRTPAGEVPEEDSVFEDKQAKPRKVESMIDHCITYREKARRMRGKSLDRRSKIQEVTMVKDLVCDIARSNVSQKSGNVKRKSETTQSKQEVPYTSVAQRKLSNQCEGDERVFSEDIKTAKRRRYSCMTPVAPKIVPVLGTPCSEILHNGPQPARKQSISTPPVIRLFGKQQLDNGIAVNDGWSPDVSPRFQTRVLHKAFAAETTNIAKDPVVKDKPKEGGDMGNEVADENNIMKPKSSRQTNETDEQSKHQHKQRKQMVCCKSPRASVSDDLKLKACVDDGAGISKPRDKPIALNTSSQIDRINVRQREVCEMLLACSPTTTECSADINAKTELLKTFLERRLGIQNAVMAYDLIVRMTDEGQQADRIMQELDRVLPQNSSVYTPLLIHVKGLEEWCS